MSTDFTLEQFGLDFKVVVEKGDIFGRELLHLVQNMIGFFDVPYEIRLEKVIQAVISQNFIVAVFLRIQVDFQRKNSLAFFADIRIMTILGAIYHRQGTGLIKEQMAVAVAVFTAVAFFKDRPTFVHVKAKFLIAVIDELDILLRLYYVNLFHSYRLLGFSIIHSPLDSICLGMKKRLSH